MEMNSKRGGAMPLILRWLVVLAALVLPMVAQAADPMTHGLVDVTDGKVQVPLPAKTLDLQRLMTVTTFDPESPPKDQHVIRDEATDSYILFTADGRSHRYYKPKNLTAYRLIWEDNPNGTRRCYDYDDTGRLLEIRHTITSGEELSKVNWHYQDKGYAFTAADGLVFGFELTEEGLPSQVICPDGSVYHYVYDADGRLVRCEQPDGYFVFINYDGAGRARELLAPLSYDDTPYLLATYHYEAGLTEVTDAAGTVTRYHHSGGRVTAREDLVGSQPYRTERFWWDSKGNLVGSARMDETDKAVWSRVFDCDAVGNVTRETLYGDLTGLGTASFEVGEGGQPLDCTVEGYSICYLHDDRQRVIEKREDNGTFALLSYFEGTDLITTQYVGDTSGIKLRSLLTYDAAGRKVGLCH
jgi:YD repeat-containing protein